MSFVRDQLLANPSYAHELLIAGINAKKSPDIISDFHIVLDQMGLPKKASWLIIKVLVTKLGPPPDDYALLEDDSALADPSKTKKIACLSSLCQRIRFGFANYESKNNPYAEENLRKALLDIAIRIIDLRKSDPSTSCFISTEINDDFFHASMEVLILLGSLLEAWVEEPGAYG